MMQRPRVVSTRLRRGISLFEVIASITLLTIVIVPVASMTRSSARLLERSGTISDQQLVRSTLRWIRDDIDQAVSTSSGSLNYFRKTTSAIPIPAVIFRSGDRLIFRSSGASETLLDDVTEWSIANRSTLNDPGNVILITLQVEDSTTGQSSRYQCSIDTTALLSDGS